MLTNFSHGWTHLVSSLAPTGFCPVHLNFATRPITLYQHGVCVLTVGLVYHRFVQIFSGYRTNILITLKALPLVWVGS